MNIPPTRQLELGPITLGGDSALVVVAGLCVIENAKHTLKIAETIAGIVARVGVPWIFKASYDKANRTSLDAARGPGLKKGLPILAQVKEEFGCPLLTDIHSVAEIAPVAEVVDIMQIPAFLCRQTDLLVAAAQTAAQAGRALNVKKGQFLAPQDIEHVIAKLEGSGCQQLAVTERGASFGYQNLVSDMRSLVIMREFGCPIIYDATHSVQLPGGQRGASGGQREFVPPLARAAVAVGVDGVFLEVHDNPDQALSDGPNSLNLNDLENLLRSLKNIDQLVKGA